MKPRPHYVRALVLLPLAAMLIACGGKEERMALHMQKAKEYLSKDNYRKAGVEIRNVLQIDPRSAEAYFIRGLVEERQGNLQMALASYRKALELNPDNLDAKTKIGHLHLLRGALQEARSTTNEILAKAPDNPRARTLHAILLVRDGEISAAAQEARTVIELDPGQTEATKLLAKIYAHQGKDTEARVVLQNGIAHNPGSVELRSDLAAFLAKRNELAEAEKLLKEIIALEPAKLEHRVALVNFYSRHRELDKAESVLRTLVEQAPDDEHRQLLLADFLTETKNAPERAKAALSAAIKANPEAYRLRFSLANLYQSTNEDDKAKQAYTEIIRLAENRPEGLMARVQLAGAYATAGDLQEADRLIGEVLKENASDNQALLLRAKLALARDRANDAIVDLRRLLKEHPDSPEIVTLLAKAHLSNNEPQLARAVLDDVVARYPHHAELRLALVAFLIRTQDLSGALKEVDAALSIEPKSLAFLQRRVELLAAKRDWPAAEDAAVELKRAAPNHVQGNYQLGRLYQQQRRYDEAAREFEDALRKAPSNLQPLAALVNTLIAQGRGRDAIGKVQEFKKDVPNSQPLNLMLAAAYASEKRYAEAEDAFQRAIRADVNSAASYLALSNFHLTRGDQKAAIAVLQQGISANPASSTLRASLAEVYHRSGDYQRAIAAYQSTLAERPASDIVSNNLAFLLTEVKGDAASLARALALAQRFETASNPFFLDTLGWIYVKLGQPDRALPLLQKAVEARPEPLFQYHLAVALHDTGEVASAKRHLARALKAKQAFMGIEAAKAMYATL